MIKYRIYSLDVWGNNREGYEVNDLCSSGIVIELKEGFTNKELIQAMKRAGYLNTKARFKSFNIEGDELALFINYNTSKVFNMPIAELRQVNP